MGENDCPVAMEENDWPVARKIGTVIVVVLAISLYGALITWIVVSAPRLAP